MLAALKKAIKDEEAEAAGPSAFEIEVSKARELLDHDLLGKEFQLMQGEREVMNLLSSTWVANRGLGSMKKTFTMVTEASASKAASLDRFFRASRGR